MSGVGDDAETAAFRMVNDFAVFTVPNSVDLVRLLKYTGVPFKIHIAKKQDPASEEV
ncbi:hypothetical protein ACP70R_021110 [Stipagrostis hirtigluma subsp. patula]